MLSSQAVSAADVTLAHRLVRGGVASDVLLLAGGAALTALLAQVSVPLPFTPVPVTLQTLSVLVVGATLGSWRGGLSQALYVLLGALGAPVFAGGQGGRLVLLGPAGGYLLGFVAAAALTGWLAERGWDRDHRAILAMLAGEVVIYAAGLAWLAQFVGWSRVVALGLAPFVVGDLAKVAAASGLLQLAWRLHPRTR